MNVVSARVSGQVFLVDTMYESVNAFDSYSADVVAFEEIYMFVVKFELEPYKLFFVHQ